MAVVKKGLRIHSSAPVVKSSGFDHSRRAAYSERAGFEIIGEVLSQFVACT